MIIAIDIDGTLLDIYKIWLDRYNEVSGDNMSLSDITRYYFYDMVKPAYKHTIAGMRIPDMYRRVKPIDGALDAIKKIRKYHQVVVVSHDGREFAQVKRSAIMRWFNIEDIVFAKNKQCIKYDLLIDDAPHNCPDILIKQPWNNIPSGTWIRRTDWTEIPYIIDRVYYIKSITSDTQRRVTHEKK